MGGLAGTAFVLIAGSPMGALVFAAAQAVPVAVLTYLASLNRQNADGSVEWYPAGRLVIAAAIIAGIFSTLTLFLLGGDVETLRSALRDMLQTFVNTELPKMPDAPTLGPAEIDEATAIALALLPAASAISTMGSLLFNLWLAGRITKASGRLVRPWPDLAAIDYPPVTPLLLAVATGAAFLPGLPGLAAAGFAGPLFLAYVLLGLAVVHFMTRGRALAAVRAVGPLRLALHHEHRRLAGDRAARPRGSRLADAPELPASQPTAAGLNRRQTQHIQTRREGDFEMQVILLERIGRLGQMGDVVNVKDGYARNFLLPQKKALRATEANRAHFETQRAQLEANNLELKKEAEAVAAKLEGKIFVAIRSAGDTGQLYGSVATRDIADAVTAGGFTIDRNQVILERPIKTLGVHKTRVALHPEVIVNVSLNVARSEDEAERQSRGEDVTMVKEEKLELETFNPDDVFEEGAAPAEGEEQPQAE